MAVVVRLFVDSADEADHDRWQIGIYNRVVELGASLDGLMAHVGYPEGSGFVMIEVWRTEALFRAAFEHLGKPSLEEVGLTATNLVVSPAWSFSRP